MKHVIRFDVVIEFVFFSLLVLFGSKTHFYSRTVPSIEQSMKKRKLSWHLSIFIFHID